MEEKKVTIFNNAKSNQKQELLFLSCLNNYFPDSEVIKGNYDLPDSMALGTLSTSTIATKIKENQVLSLSKKDKCISELVKLPDEIKIIRTVAEISVDFTILAKEKVHFIEFHEKQHKIDSNNRLNNVYSINNDVIKVPRYLQRLLRDIWRVKYLDNYKIVWYDWFERSQEDIFKSTNKEFALDGQFKISDLV